MTECRVCRSEVNALFQKVVLGQYPVSYENCENCGLLQVSDPYFLEEACSDAISDMDVGQVRRAEALTERTLRVIRTIPFLESANFLDYGGGYGLFVRMMRDRGYRFSLFDKYCQNVFAKGFSVHSLDDGRHYGMMTSFEVLEHLTNPVQVMSELLERTDNILFTTEIQPDSDLESWHYLVPETGQHVTFYTMRSLQKLAAITHATLISDGRWLHMLTRETSHRIQKQLRSAVNGCLSYRERIVHQLSKNHRPMSLTEEDSEHIKRTRNE